MLLLLLRRKTGYRAQPYTLDLESDAHYLANQSQMDPSHSYNEGTVEQLLRVLQHTGLIDVFSLHPSRKNESKTHLKYVEIMFSENGGMKATNSTSLRKKNGGEGVTFSSKIYRAFSNPFS